MTIAQAICTLAKFGVWIRRPLAGVYFAGEYQVTESEIIRWALILGR